MKVKKRHGRWQRIATPFIVRAIKKRFNFDCEKFDIKPPFLVFANHATDYDAFFVARIFQNPIYFLMSDHVATIPVAGRLIKLLVSPLPITKSAMDIGAVREIMSAVWQGASVGIFPEGNKSFAGDVSWIKPSTAKLARKLEVPVVIVNIEGGFLSSPRFTKNKRKGKIRAFVKEVIAPEELKALSNEEVQARIVEGLRVNAYEVQKREKQKYVGENLAEGIETMLYACPECKGISTLHGTGNDIVCTKCDATCSLDEYGYVSGGKFERLDKWDKFQKQLISELDPAGMPSDKVILHDKAWMVAKKCTKYKSAKLGVFDSILFSDRFVLTNENDTIEIPLSEIVGMAVEGINGIQISSKNGDVFRLKNETTASALKYVNFIWTIKGEIIRF